jgi:hypothetical protein
MSSALSGSRNGGGCSESCSVAVVREIDDAAGVGVAPEVQERLVVYMEEIASGLGRVEQRRAAGFYARGLIEQGTRKSLEPVVARLGGGSAEYEALQHFLADSPWDATCSSGRSRSACAR